MLLCCSLNRASAIPPEKESGIAEALLLLKEWDMLGKGDS